MNSDKYNKVYELTEELIELFKTGNITLEQVYEDSYTLLNHPDFDKAIDILATLEDIMISKV